MADAQPRKTTRDINAIRTLTSPVPESLYEVLDEFGVYSFIAVYAIERQRDHPLFNDWLREQNNTFLSEIANDRPEANLAVNLQCQIIPHGEQILVQLSADAMCVRRRDDTPEAQSAAR